jgi:predicted unusual protein kinase regulating ubiquinone biosynthesis (AarF/ABC1/UbiB family)
MFDYPFRVPARFALIIRAVVSQEGLALRIDPEFKIIGIAYPYVAKRLLAGDSIEMREKLLEVIFDNNGHLRLERIESLLQVISQDAAAPDAELIPVAGAGLKLLFSPDGSALRSRLLMTLIKDDRLSTADMKSLISLLGKTFSPRKVANGMLQKLSPINA